MKVMNFFCNVVIVILYENFKKVFNCVDFEVVLDSCFFFYIVYWFEVIIWYFGRIINIGF